MPTPDEIRAAAKALMPEVLDDLATLVGHASVSFPRYPAQPVRACAEALLGVFKRAGFDDVRLIETSGHPLVWAEVPAPAGAPTVLLYGHYDVQPAPVEEQGWSTDPWTLTAKDDGRLYGRGAADDKGGILVHAAAIRALGWVDGADGHSVLAGPDALGIGIKVVIEGEEETLSNLEALVEQDPERFSADVFLIADMGNIEPGEPVLTTTLRGDVNCLVTVRTIDHAVHSGIFGGPAPDALVALIMLLATLHDERGNTVVGGLHGFEWPGAGLPEDLYRDQSGMLPGVELIGDGSIATRLWSKPNVTVIGLDAPRTADASNILIPSATARLSMRIAPGEDEDAALDALAHWLETRAPWGAQVEVEKVKAAPAFQAPAGGPAMLAAHEALAEAYGKPSSEVGSGGSIPLLETLRKLNPGAELVLWGVEDTAHSRIHGGDESVDPAEIERMIVAEALLLQALARR